ncbi:hypothetical protein [Ekhidna sp.]
MDLIREMAHVIEQDRPKSFGLLIPKDSKLKKLYDLAVNSKLNEKEISNKLYKSKPGDKRFLMLKGSLINKLSELILIGEHSDINKNNYIKVQFECEKQLTIAKKLLFVNVYHNAEKIVKKTLKEAIKYHLVEVEVECYVLMRKINYLKGFPDTTEEFNSLASRALQVSSKVNDAKGTTEMFLSEIKFLRAQSKKVAEKCGKYVFPLVANDKESPFIELAVLRIRLIKAHQENDIQEWSQTISEIHGFLKAYPYLMTEHLALELNVSDAKYHLAIREYKKANKTITSILKYTSFESFNQFEVLAEQFHFHCHQGQLKKASKVITKVFDSYQFDMLDGMDKAAWHIRAAYLRIVIDYSDSSIEFDLFVNKKLTVFFNACKPISKDKAGYQFQFIIARLLLLHSKDSIDYESEHNSLKVYHTRHLKGNLPVRGAIFYSHLSKLTKARFSKKAYDQLSESIANEFNKHPQYIEHCEVFRYEYLWDAIANKLRQ